MPLRVSDLRLPVDAAEGELLALAVRRAGLAASDVTAMDIVRRSVDRRHHRLVGCYTVDLHLSDEAERGVPRSRAPGVASVVPAVLAEEPQGEAPLPAQPVIIGSGPAGLFAALHLARRGFRPVILERGDPMNLRTQRIRDVNRHGVLDPESNYLFGEGGAGTFSDGKLTSRSKDPRTDFVLQEFRTKSGIASVTYDYRPHLGSDRVRAVVGRLRTEILGLGGEFHYRRRAEDLVLRDGTVAGVRTSSGEIPAGVVILGPGHSARDLLRRLAGQGLRLERKPFQLGFRVEHPQEWVDRAVYGHHLGHPALGPADYRLAVRTGGTTVFSFCMCPGGEIIPAVCDLGHMNTNGMSWSGRATGFANSGVVTTLDPNAFGGEGSLAGVELQERYESRAAALVGHRLAVPAQRLLDYLEDHPSADLPQTSCRTGIVSASLRDVVPPLVDRLLREALRLMDRQMRGFLHPGAVLVGPESRSSSPVRMLRDAETLQSLGIDGLYPVGEGAGYAGGIVSSAVDGLRAAQAVARRFHPAVRP